MSLIISSSTRSNAPRSMTASRKHSSIVSSTHEFTSWRSLEDADEELFSHGCCQNPLEGAGSHQNALSFSTGLRRTLRVSGWPRTKVGSVPEISISGPELSLALWLPCSSASFVPFFALAFWLGFAFFGLGDIRTTLLLTVIFCSSNLVSFYLFSACLASSSWQDILDIR